MSTRDESPERLGSLTQKARSKKLNEIRLLLFFIGGLTVVINGIFLAQAEDEVRKAGLPLEAVSIVQAFYGGFLGLGVLFLIFGAIVHLYPVVITILSLVLYIAAHLVLVVLTGDASVLAYGAVIKILIIVGLAKGIQTAVAYEKERREQEFLPADE